MASTYSKNMQIYSAEKFKNSVSESNVYLTFGYSVPWNNDYSPPQANTSIASFNETWQNIIGGKKITGNDIRFSIPRFDWRSGQTYIAYDDLTDDKILNNSNTQFYVITDEFNVYKCIANNYSQPSTQKPTSTNPTSQFQTADFYIWKYMYTLNNEEQLRFTTDQYIPVKTLMQNDNSLQWQVQEDAVPGAIHNILVTNLGNGYVSNSISVTITGDGRYANAFAVRDMSNNNIKYILLDNKGSGYTYANVTITSSRGNNATARAIISPPGGHGSDPLRELGGSYLILNIDLNGNENGILTTKNDYRQIAMIENPIVYGTTNVMSNLAFSQATVLSLSESTSGLQYIHDEIVYQGSDYANSTFRGVVTEWDSANALIKLTRVDGSPTSQLLTGKNSTASRYVNFVNSPDLQPYSGFVLYKDNIRPITRDDDQNEDFKIVLSF